MSPVERFLAQALKDFEQYLNDEKNVMEGARKGRVWLGWAGFFGGLLCVSGIVVENFGLWDRLLSTGSAEKCTNNSTR